MGVALYVVLDNQDPGFDVMVDGKAVGKAADKLNRICSSIGLSPVDDFVSMSMEEVGDMLGEEIPEVAEKWFDAQDGIAYFTKLSSYLQANPASLVQSKSVVQDIEDYIGVLQQAKTIGAKWRLSVDI
jgi:hypothetical protein